MTSTHTPQSTGTHTEPEVSVIVPVYNTAPYLQTCLDSLRNQTLVNIEIICVNDGSTDDSLAILEANATEDQRIIVISQTNQGMSAARNAALKVARAPYIMNCDSDDWFDADMCRLMRDTLEAEEVDLVICEVNIVLAVPEELQENVSEYYRLGYEGKQEITQELMLTTNISFCNKIFKRETIERHSIEFPYGLHYEDAYFSDAYMSVSESIYFLRQPLYNYVRHGTSVMSTTYKKSGIAIDHLYIMFNTWDFFEREGLLESYSEFFWKRYFRYTINAFKHVEGDDLKKARKLAHDFVKSHKESFEQASFKTRSSIRVLLSGNFEAMHALYLRYKRLRKKDAPKPIAVE